MAEIVGVGWEREQLDANIQSTLVVAEATALEFTKYPTRHGTAHAAYQALGDHLLAIGAREAYQKRWEAAQRWDQQRKAEVPLW